MNLKMVIPKGRMNANVVDLLADTGIHLRGSSRSYRPLCNVPDLELKLLKSQNIPTLVALGQHDCGFAGKDWIEEQNAEVEEILDLGFDPVRIVACIPEDWNWENVRGRKIIAVSEYRRLCTDFLNGQGIDHTFVRSYGATEVFPPEDADLIVDNSASGRTLEENRLKEVGCLMESSTRFIADREAMEHPEKRERIEDLKLLFEAVLVARGRVLLEMNCGENDLDTLVDILPAMKSPTISKLHRASGFSLKAAVPKDKVKDLIPVLRRHGATDILEMPIRKVIP